MIDEKLMRLIRDATKIPTWEDHIKESRQAIFILATLTALIFVGIIVMAALRT